MGKSALLNKAIEAVQQLPEAEQDVIARVILDWNKSDAKPLGDMLADDVFESEMKWQKVLKDPASHTALDELVRQAREDIAAGNVSNLTPADRGKD